MTTHDPRATVGPRLCPLSVLPGTARPPKQRKRWLNGALFALFYAFMHAKQFYTRYDLVHLGQRCCALGRRCHNQTDFHVRPPQGIK